MAQSKIAHRLFAASALALTMAACNDDTRARIDAPEPASLAELAVISDLPPAAPAPVRDYLPERGYPLAERAYGLQQAFYDVPPDYGFAYDDGRSYVWETEDDWEMYAEPWDGGYRYYYYEPGAAYPYFVRDRSYGYGFNSVGVLIAVFDSGGRYLSRDYAYRAAPMAGRYWSRGHELWQARRSAPRIQIDERVWVEQAPRLVRTSDSWLKAAREDRDWRAWRDRDNDRELKRFAREQQRREASAQAWRQRLAQQEVRDDRRFDREDRREGRDEQRRLQVDRERQAQAELAQRQARAEQAGRQQADRRAAEMRLAERRQRQEQAREQARGQQQAERRQQQAQAERGRQEQQARVEQRQRQQAERQQQRVQAVQAERQAREHAQQQARAQHQAREQQQQARQHQQRQQAQAQQQAREAQHAARQQAQQQARQEQQQARQAQQQQARQAQQQQARAAEQQARNANAREARPDRGRGREKDKN